MNRDDNTSLRSRLAWAVIVPLIMLCVIPLSAEANKRWSQKKQAGSSEDRQLLTGATRLAQEHRFAEAQALLLQALKSSPENSELLLALGKVDASLGELTSSIQLLRRVVASEPANSDADYNLAIALADAGKLPEALSSITAAEALDTKSERLHLNRARILAQMNRISESAKEYAIAKRLAPRDPNVYLYWALLERSQANVAEECELLTTLTHLSPHSGSAFYLLGKCFAAQGKMDASIGALRMAVKLSPRSQAAIYSLAMEMRTRDPKAEGNLMARFQRLREQQASLSGIRILGNEAVHDSASGQWSRAIGIFRRALVRCAGCSLEAGLRKDLGLVLCRNGQVAEGTDELKESLKLDPNDPETVQALQILQDRSRLLH